MASLHSAKGLEWEAVFLVGLCEGLMPITFAQTQRELDEERRLLYVGITRAKTLLYLSSAAARHPGGRGRRKSSRFLIPLRKELGLEAPTRRIAPGSGKLSVNAAARKRKAAVCAGCGEVLTVGAEISRRRCAECPPRYDEEAFESLRAWRLSYSKELGLPAFMVFSDATLEMIAEKKPRTDEELLAIPGIGQRKLEQHGDRLRAALREFSGAA